MMGSSAAIPKTVPTLKFILIELAIVCAIIGCFYSSLITQSGLPSGADVTSMLWPMREFTKASMVEFGSVPLWNPFHYLGMPFAATLQHSVFYPPTLIIQLLSPYTMSGMRMELLFHLLLAGCGAWWFARFPLRVGAASALFAGVVFACQMKMQYALENGVILASIAYVPWCLGIVWLACNGRLKARVTVCTLAGLVALQFLSGHPQAFLYTRICEGLLAISLLFLAHANFRASLKQLGILALAGALGIALCSVQLFPTLELAPTTYRSIYKLINGYALQICFTPDMLNSYINPEHFENQATNQTASQFSEYLVYIGLLPLLFSGFALHQLKIKKQHRIIGFLLLAIFVCFVFMLSANLAIGPILHGEFSTMPQGSAVTSAEKSAAYLLYLSPLEVMTKTLPLLDGMRAPARFSVFLNFLIIMLASVGLHALLLLIKQTNFRRLAGFFTLLGAILNLYIPSMKAPFRDLVLPLEAGDSQTLAEQLQQPNPVRQFRLTLSDDDRVQATLSPDWEVRQQSFNQRVEFDQENLNILNGHMNVEGYEEGLAPTIRTKDFLFQFNRHLRTPTPDSVFLHLIGVQNYRTDLPIDPAFVLKSTTLSGTQNLVQLNKTAGLAYWKTQFSGIDWESLEGPNHFGNEPAYGRVGALQIYGKTPAFSPTNQPITVQFETPNRIQLSWEGEAPASLLFSQGYIPNWFANGAPLKWRNAVIAEIPSEQLLGAQQVILEYKPRSVQWGFLITVAALFGWIILVITCIPSTKRVGQ